VSHLKIKIPSKNMCEKPTNVTIINSVDYVWQLPEDGNVMPKHAGATIHN
jgi:hypothetical protein